MTNSPSNRASITAEAIAFHKDPSWLGEETVATSSERFRALLLYEAGYLSEQADNVTEAARLYLQAVNTDARLSVPVERLLAMFEQRHSSKNVGRIVERLGLLAESAEERERAALERAAYALVVQQDITTAKRGLLELVESVPASACAWNLLNCIAEYNGDSELLQLVLRSRAALRNDTTWSGLLLTELAETQHRLGQCDEAFSTLEQIIEAGGASTFPALEMMQRMAFGQHDHAMLARAHIGQSQLLEKSIHDSSFGDAADVPRWRRSVTHVADALLRAALARHAAGSTSEAAALLEKAYALLPTDPLLQYVTLHCASELSDFELAVTLCRVIATRTEGLASAVAWMRAALFELSRHDESKALQCVANGMAQTKSSIALRGLELHLLAADYRQSQYSTALEAAADLMTTDSAKSRYFIAAANNWARNSNDAASAKAALAQAAMLGAPASVVNRFAHLLAIELNDRAWYEETTRRLTSTANSEAERTEYWLELLRLRIVKGQWDRISRVIAGLRAEPSGHWLSAYFEAWWSPAANLLAQSSEDDAPASFIPSPESDLQSDSPLKRIAVLCSSAPYKLAYELVDVVRALRGGRVESAISELTALVGREPNSVLLNLTLTDLLVSRGTMPIAIDQMCRAAHAIDDDNIAAMLAIKSLLLAAQLGDADRFAACLDSAGTRAPAAAASIGRWLGRLFLPEAARLELSSPELDARTNPDWVALVQFAREVRRQNLAAAGQALDQIDTNNQGISVAAALAQLLLDANADRAVPDDVAILPPQFSPIVGAWRVRHVLTNGGLASNDHLAAARQWCDDDRSIASALEYLVAARARGKFDAERSAWEMLSACCPDRLKTQVVLAQTRFEIFGNTRMPALLSTQLDEAKLLNLESSRPGCDPRRRHQSLQDANAFFDEADQRISAILVAYNSLAAGFVERALQQFKAIVTHDDHSISAWEGLRLAAEIQGDFESLAQACETLGSCMGDAAAAAEFYEQAANVCFESLHDDARGERLLNRAVSSDISRFSSFDRLFRRVRGRNDGPRLLELIDLRLNISDDVDELVKLHWERARVFRGMGDREAALQALENVTLLEPNHVGALALAAEVAISNQQLEDATKYLDQLARLDAAPSKQRLMSAIAAADLYESKLNKPELAVSLLLAINQSGLATLDVRERLARCAAQAQNWPLAYDIALGLAHDRDTSAGRVEAARLSMSICREKLESPASALPAVERVLEELPADLEVIDFLLEQPFSADQNHQLCTQGLAALRTQLQDAPLDVEAIDRLAQLSACLSDAPLRQVALGALMALDAGSDEIADELLDLEARAARVPAVAMDAACLAELTDPEDGGPFAELFEQLATAYHDALGPHLSVLNVSKKNRMDPRAGLPLRNEIAAWAGALGLGEFDLYVGGVGADDVVGVPSEVPALVVGSALHSPLTARQRQSIAGELYAMRRGISILRHRTPPEIAALVVATCRVAEVGVSAPPYAMTDEFTRLLSSSFSRKIRKLLPNLCVPLGKTALDVVRWYTSAVASRDRLAALAAGDVSLVVGRDTGSASIDNSVTLNERRKRLLPYVFSPQYLALRERVGVDVK